MDEFKPNTNFDQNAQSFEIDNLLDSGLGEFVYIRQIDSGSLAGIVEEIPNDLPMGLVWAMFSAQGEPMMIAETRADILSAAMENELRFATLN